MPRPLRVQYPGAICHLMSRGDHREPTFRDDIDRRRFLETLGAACEKTGWQVHAWCLPSNYLVSGWIGTSWKPSALAFLER